MVALEQNLDSKVLERINSLRSQRDSAVNETEQRFSVTSRQEIEERREQDLEAARHAESETLAELRAAMNRPAADDIVFAPTDSIIVKAGDVATPKHLDILERIAETSRNAIAEQARRELEASVSESKREVDRLGLEYQGQIDTAQSQLERERNETRQRIEQARRDLESLKKMDLLPENRGVDVHRRQCAARRPRVSGPATRRLSARPAPRGTSPRRCRPRACTRPDR